MTGFVGTLSVGRGTAGHWHPWAQTSLLLAPPLQDIELLDWYAFERAIEIGYRHAREVLGRAAAPRDLP